MNSVKRNTSTTIIHPNSNVKSKKQQTTRRIQQPIISEEEKKIEQGLNSIRNKIIIAPTANADRLIKIPKNKPKEKNPTSFTKKASKNHISEKIIPTSV